MSGSNAILHMSRTQSTVRKKMATGSFTYNALRTKTLKERIKTQRKIGPQCERVPRESDIVMALVGWEWT